MNLSETLEPIAAFFRGLGVPAPIVHWGHPAMMGIVVLILGSYVAWSGWQGRLAADKEVAIKNRLDHRKAAPLMTLFITLGYTGGVLSLVMQHKPILESPHFWTGNVVLGLLFLNGAIAASGFGGEKGRIPHGSRLSGHGSDRVTSVAWCFGVKTGSVYLESRVEWAP